MKYFTVEEADRSLSLVSPIMLDIVSKMDEAQRLHQHITKEKEKIEQQKASQDSHISETETHLRADLNRLEKLLNDIEYHSKELERVGVLLKDLRLGVIDFPSLRDSIEIYLCWMIGEQKVHFWHEPGNGFEQRKMIDEKVLTTTTH